MIRGAFRSFVHDHYFEPSNSGTVMRDELRFAAPFGPLGWLAEVLVLRGYLKRFLTSRNKLICATAEGSGWRRYLDAAEN